MRKEICRIRPPTGFGLNLSRAFKKQQPTSPKTHDWHVLLQYFLPIALRGHQDPRVFMAFADLSVVYRWVCSKEINIADIPHMKLKLAETMAKLEEEMPSTFWNIMQHLIIHLVDEVESHRTVHMRWMYYIERHMKVLKSFVRQRA